MLDDVRTMQIPRVVPHNRDASSFDSGTIRQSAEHATVSSNKSTKLSDFPGYELHRELARGGMGVVYHATDTKLKRPVAIKMILGGQYASLDSRIRFEIEAEAIAAVEHPNVVQVYGSGIHDGQPFFVLEYVSGGTLANKIKREGRLASKDAAALLLKLAQAMAVSHGKAIIHRDLKPANVLLTETGEPKITDFGLARIGDAHITGSNAQMGTPAYMAPEQALGQTKDIGTPADVYSLGAILFEMLAGKAPFQGESVISVLQLVTNEPPTRLRSLYPDVAKDLETICLKCLAKEPAKRYDTAAALADDLQAYLDGHPIAARPVNTIERMHLWAKRKPARAVGVVAMCVLIVAMGLAFSRFRVQQQEAQAQRNADLLEAERKRHADQRQTRAALLVDALANADTAAVSRILTDLSDYSDLTSVKLQTLAQQPITTKVGLHARMALLATEPSRAKELAEYLLVCQPSELLPVRGLLTTDTATIAEPLWNVLLDAKAANLKRGRAAAALAGFTPHDKRWPKVAETVAEWVVRQNPLEAEEWAKALEPVRGVLVPPLMARYVPARSRIESGKLAISPLVAEASAFELTAQLLARFTKDRPADLAELALIVDARHYPLFDESLLQNQEAVKATLKTELAKTPNRAWKDESHESFARRQSHAAATAFKLGDSSATWPMLKFTPDPTARSYLIQRLAGIGAPAGQLITRYESETDVTVKCAILIALGDYPPETIPDRAAFTVRLLTQYRTAPDAGLHGALDWLLRQKWGQADALTKIDHELAKAEAKEPRPDPKRGWYVNGQGQTYTILRTPTDFAMGSPFSEETRAESEMQHTKRIPRTIAIATKEVTTTQFQKFRKNYMWIKRYSPDTDSPALNVNWYDAAAYCNWLSEQEGIPKSEWCYEPNSLGNYDEGMTIKANHLKLAGYRLPTEAEWECVARVGVLPARYYGRGTDLLGRYVRYATNSEDRAWPVGQLRPNDLGLFDMLGNALEWVEDIAMIYNPNMKEDRPNPSHSPVTNVSNRILRGGSFGGSFADARSAYRVINRPDARNVITGFRPTRTMPVTD